MNILTFDIEDWFHILDNPSTQSAREWSRYESRIRPNIDRILEMLAAHQQNATFFCLGWIAEQHPDVIRSIVNAGHEIASHSFMHQLVYGQTPQAFREDLRRSIHVIEDIAGKKIRAFRAPGFSITRENVWAFDVLIEVGIEIDCSVFPAARAHGGIADFGAVEPVLLQVGGGVLKEFPISVARIAGKRVVFSGGGYFRLIPYVLARRLMQGSNYVMTYFHPRDFDPFQPVIPELSRLRRFKSYIGLGRALDKLNRLLSDFDFVDLATAEQMVDWSSARCLQIPAPNTPAP